MIHCLGGNAAYVGKSALPSDLSIFAAGKLERAAALHSGTGETGVPIPLTPPICNSSATLLFIIAAREESWWVLFLSWQPVPVLANPTSRVRDSPNDVVSKTLTSKLGALVQPTFAPLTHRGGTEYLFRDRPARTMAGLEVVVPWYFSRGAGDRVTAEIQGWSVASYFESPAPPVLDK